MTEKESHNNSIAQKSKILYTTKFMQQFKPQKFLN